MAADIKGGGAPFCAPKDITCECQWYRREMRLNMDLILYRLKKQLHEAHNDSMRAAPSRERLRN